MDLPSVIAHANLLSAVGAAAALGFAFLWFRYGFDEVRNWLRVLWVCRVSVVSVLAGLFLLGAVVQAQDVFAETSRSLLRALGYWGLFLAFLFLGWAFPVHFAARWILDLEDWALDPRRAGLARSQRRALLQARYRRAITWVPRILGVLCFVAAGWGIWAAWSNLAASAQRLPQANQADAQLPWLLAATALTGALFWGFVLRRHVLARKLEAKLGAAPAEETGRGQGLLTRDFVFFHDFVAWLRGLGRPASGPAGRGFSVLEQGIALALLLTLTFGFVVALSIPFFVADRLPRAMFLVTMLGSPVFLFTALAAYGHRKRLPLIAMMIVFFSAMTTQLPNLHAVRLIGEGAADPARAARQVALGEAIERWKTANGCGSGGSCRPIILAGQGGASRAGFYTASVVGELLDRTRKDPAVYDDFGKRLFALSTVSGSSVGAVVVRAALADAGAQAPAGGASTAPGPPCRRLGGDLWFGDLARRAERPWRSCLQSILAGDFLSPTFVGLAYRDNLPLPGLSDRIADRAALIEMAWERRYAWLLRQEKAGEDSGLRRRFGYWTERVAESGQPWLPLLLLNGTSVATGRRLIVSDVFPWVPSVGQDKKPDRQAIFSEAFDLFEVLASCRPKKTLSAGGTCPEDIDETSVRRGADIALSTGGTMSARWPVISPSGALRNAAGAVVEDVVDGGYFENDGLITARELAEAVCRLDPTLQPIILHVANDPIRPPPDPEDAASGGGRRAGEPPAPIHPPRPPRAHAPLLPGQPIDRFLAGYTSIGFGLFNTREGHGAEAAQEAVEFIGNKPYWLQVKVYSDLPGVQGPERKRLKRVRARERAITMEKLSMSWWLSQPVQEYLDAQLDHAPANRSVLEDIGKLLRKDQDQTNAAPCLPGQTR